METKYIFQFEITINVLYVAISALFEYLCHGFYGYYIFFILSVRGPSLDVRI